MKFEGQNKGSELNNDITTNGHGIRVSVQSSPSKTLDKPPPRISEAWRLCLPSSIDESSSGLYFSAFVDKLRRMAEAAESPGRPAGHRHFLTTGITDFTTLLLPEARVAISVKIIPAAACTKLPNGLNPRKRIIIKPPSHHHKP
jgi:hypothetical protein